MESGVREEEHDPPRHVRNGVGLQSQDGGAAARCQGIGCAQDAEDVVRSEVLPQKRVTSRHQCLVMVITKKKKKEEKSKGKRELNEREPRPKKKQEKTPQSQAGLRLRAAAAHCRRRAAGFRCTQSRSACCSHRAPS